MSEKLSKLELQKQQLQARIDKIRRQENEKNRKLETRRKIVAGAAFLRLKSETEHELLTQRVWNACLQYMSEKDKELFKISNINEVDSSANTSS